MNDVDIVRHDGTGKGHGLQHLMIKLAISKILQVCSQGHTLKMSSPKSDARMAGTLTVFYPVIINKSD
jgi:hypothetical protein